MEDWPECYLYLYLWVDGPASSLASVVHIAFVVAVIGILEVVVVTLILPSRAR